MVSGRPMSAQGPSVPVYPNTHGAYALNATTWNVPGSSAPSYVTSSTSTSHPGAAFDSYAYDVARYTTLHAHSHLPEAYAPGQAPAQHTYAAAQTLSPSSDYTAQYPSSMPPHARSGTHAFHDELPLPGPSYSVSAPLTSTTSTSGRARCHICPDKSFGRTAELQRHMETCHRGEGAPSRWVCCGVPLRDAVRHGVPADALASMQRTEYFGIAMVGGCGVRFSRKDAYQRHLNRRDNQCYGDADGEYFPGS